MAEENQEEVGGQVGIDEIKDILKFAFAISKAVEGSLADKKIGMDDIAQFLPVLLAAGDAFDNLSLFVKQVKDLDEAELSELHAFVVQEFDLENDKIEAFIESGLGLALNLYKLVVGIMGYKKEE
jgi:hypothetical protein